MQIFPLCGKHPGLCVQQSVLILVSGSPLRQLSLIQAINDGHELCAHVVAIPTQ